MKKLRNRGPTAANVNLFETEAIAKHLNNLNSKATTAINNAS